jgi:uracil-DNA glycosylase family 4
LLVGDVPWYGTPRGQLERFCKRWGIDWEGFALHALISCTPPGYRLGYMPYEGSAITSCGANLAKTIDQFKPHVIVPMGEMALRYVLGESKLLRWRGRVVEKEFITGLGKRHKARVVPTFHPRDLLPTPADKEKNIFSDERAAVLANPARFTGILQRDLHLAVRLAKEGFERRDTYYLCDPDVTGFWAWVNQFEEALVRDGPELMLSWDIETPYKLKAKDDDAIDEKERDNQIIRISFSYQPGRAVSVEWSPTYLPAIRRLLASQCVQVGWNCDTFDVPLVKAAGVAIGGEVHDYMWGFHCYQSDLPKGLEFVSSLFTDILPWKHLNNAEPAKYSCIDADAALQNALGIRDQLVANGQYETFLRHVVHLDPILVEAGARGSLIDQAKQDALTEQLGLEKARLLELVQDCVPRSLRPKKRFKKLPKDSTGRCFEPVLTAGKVKVCSHCRTAEKAATHFKGGKKNPCKAAGATMVVVDAPVEEFDEVLEFNPNSSLQLMAYMRAFNHPIGKNKQDRTKDSAGADHLARLAKRYPHHPLYGLTIEMHKVSKALSTYVEGFKPDAQGLIHTTYDHTPSTWRLASKAVNLQNVGKSENNKWAKDARKQIVSRPGHIFVQADSSAIEAVFVGYFMQDPAYIDLARKGVHAFLACKVKGWEFTDANIARIKSDEAALYRACKITVHGTNFGMGPGLMAETHPHLFPTRRVAEQWQQKLFDAVPGLKAWQTKTRIRAHKETYLQNPWKHRHYFYAVLQVEQDGSYTLGPDSKRVIAYLPQSSAGSFMHDNLALIGQTWLRPYMPAHVSVHDGYCVDVPLARKQEAAATLIEILTRPIPEMGGLRVGCEIEEGYNWGAMTTTQTITVS